MRTALLGALVLLAAIPVLRTAIGVGTSWTDDQRNAQAVALKQTEKLLLETARNVTLEHGLSALAIARPGLALPNLQEQLQRHRAQAAAGLAGVLAGPSLASVDPARAALQASDADLASLRGEVDSLFNAGHPGPELARRWEQAGTQRIGDLLALARLLVLESLRQGLSDPAADLLLLATLDLHQQVGREVDPTRGEADPGERRNRALIQAGRTEAAWDVVRDRAALLPVAAPSLRNAEAAWFQRFLPVRTAWIEASGGESLSSETLRAGLSALMAVQDLAGTAVQHGLDAVEQRRQDSRISLGWALLRLLLATALAVFLALLVRQRLLKPLASMTEAMGAVARGDLDRPLRPVDGSPEFAEAWQSLETFKATARRLAAELEERRRVERQLTVERSVLELAASRAALPDVLDALCRGVEFQIAGSRCSILLLDEDGLHMRMGAAPNLSADFLAGIDGSPIGPEAGSCGAALYRKMPVITADIRQDRRWSGLRHLAEAESLRACWSMPILGGDGTALGTFAVYLTLSKEPDAVEMDLLRRASHLAALAIAGHRAAEQLELAKAEAELGSRTKSEFLANMSHELRTPLNAIIGFAEVLEAELSQGGASATAGYAGDIIASGRHLLTLINDILDVSKMESGRVELRERICGVADLLHGCERIVRARALERRLTLTVEVPPGLPPMLVDDVKFKQIILNLLSNAIKFTAPGGRVRVSASLDPARGLSVAVSDTGVGIREEDLARVFIPFHQVDNVYARSNPGTGLGLTLAKGLAELHGGRLTLESVFGVGTTATLQLPVSRVLWVEMADDPVP